MRLYACVSLCAIGDAVSLYPTTLALAPTRCLLAARPPTGMGRGERAPEPEEDERMTASAEERQERLRCALDKEVQACRSSLPPLGVHLLGGGGGQRGDA